MIIQCPSCNTRFSIDTTQLTAVAVPRFHCSRCDHFFEKPNFTDIPQTVREESARPGIGELVSNFQEQHTPRQLDLLPRTEQLRFDPVKRGPSNSAPGGRSAAAKANPGLFGEHQAPREFPFQRLDLDDVPDTVTANWPDADSSTERVADLRDVLDELRVSSLASTAAAASAPTPEPHRLEPVHFASNEQRGHESRLETRFELGVPSDMAAFPKASAAISSNYAASSSDAAALTTKSAELPSTELPSTLFARSSSVARHGDSEYSSFSSPSVTSHDVTSHDATSHSATSHSVASRTGSKKRRFLGGWLRTKGLPVAANRISPVLLASAVPLLLCVGFYLWSIDINSTPGIFRTVFYPAASELPRVAPLGIELTNLHSEVVTLDDGQQVLQVSGEVTNNTNRFFKNIRIQARTYDAGNRAISSAIANAGNSLITARRLAALDPEALTKLQAESTVSENPLAPGRASLFKMIVPTALVETSWYSARVYSVQPYGSVQPDSSETDVSFINNAKG